MKIGQRIGSLIAVGALTLLPTVVAAPDADAVITGCNEKVKFTNRAAVVVDKFMLNDGNGDVWTSTGKYAVLQSVTVSLQDLGVTEGASLRAFASEVSTSPPYIQGDRTFKYCRNGTTATFDLWGTAFKMWLTQGDDVY
ncbi:hypothetical protein [Nocardia terpenica]|nr:hypothetical protein [Nocardia terpenica]NQE87517.1 hypothetical protein [Nocardia terpenica]